MISAATVSGTRQRSGWRRGGIHFPARRHSGRKIGRRFPATIDRATEVAQGRNATHYARRTPGAPGARAQADVRQLPRRGGDDGRHFAALLHRHALVGRRRMFALVLPGQGRGVLCMSAFEEGRAREQLNNAPDGDHADVRTWQEDENPYQLVAQGLKDRGIAAGKLRIEETMPLRFRRRSRESSRHKPR